MEEWCFPWRYECGGVDEKDVDDDDDGFVVVDCIDRGWKVSKRRTELLSILVSKLRFHPEKK